MELTVYNQDGSESDKSVSLDPTVFDIEPNDHVIWLDVRRVQAHQRQGTHKTKERSDVQGSRRKLYRQKGTGNSRAGDAKSPIRKTGGRAHGPRPRNYRMKINKKTRQLARRSALTYKTDAGEIRVVEDFTLDAPNTRALADILANLDLTEEKVLILTSQHEPAIYRSSKNLPKVSVKEGRNAHTVDILDAGIILVQEGALETITDILRTEDEAVAA